MFPYDVRDPRKNLYVSIGGGVDNIILFAHNLTYLYALCIVKNKTGNFYYSNNSTNRSYKNSYNKEK